MGTSRHRVPHFIRTSDRYVWAWRKFEHSILESGSWVGYGSLCYPRVTQQQIWPELAELAINGDKENPKRASTIAEPVNVDVG